MSPLPKLQTSFNRFGHLTLADPFDPRGNALRDVSPRSEINQFFEECLRHDAALAHRQREVIRQLREALAGMQESLNLALGPESNFPDPVKESLRGWFLGEPERAVAAMAASEEE